MGNKLLQNQKLYQLFSQYLENSDVVKYSINKGSTLDHISYIVIKYNKEIKCVNYRIETKFYETGDVSFSYFKSINILSNEELFNILYSINWLNSKQKNYFYFLDITEPNEYVSERRYNICLFYRFKSHYNLCEVLVNMQTCEEELESEAK